ncbi:MAG: hypothetical protein P1P80_09875 [ANME-2 cluster archaeon]|nr:hypothetical protein [ANME-2 cluster archaeon]
MVCIHESCGNIDKVWLPFVVNDKMCGLKAHPYCVQCGAVKNISTDRPIKAAYYINSLSKIDKRVVKLTKVQIRLIVKELEGIKDFEDAYSMTRQAQEKAFINIVQKYCNVFERNIVSVLRN